MLKSSGLCNAYKNERSIQLVLKHTDNILNRKDKIFCKNPRVGKRNHEISILQFLQCETKTCKFESHEHDREKLVEDLPS